LREDNILKSIALPPATVFAHDQVSVASTRRHLLSTGCDYIVGEIKTKFIHEDIPEEIWEIAVKRDMMDPHKRLMFAVSAGWKKDVRRFYAE